MSADRFEQLVGLLTDMVREGWRIAVVDSNDADLAEDDDVYITVLSPDLNTRYIDLDCLDPSVVAGVKS